MPLITGEEKTPPDGDAAEPEPAASEPAAAVALEFDWGCVPVVDGFIIGRDEEQSPIGRRLEGMELSHVSRVHAQLNIEDGRIYLTDCGSLNKTWRNDEPVGKAKAEVFDGDVLKFSKSLTATLRISYKKDGTS